MSRPWYQSRPKLLQRISADLRDRYPELRAVEEGGIIFIRGSYPVLHDGRTLDRYQVEIEFPHDYPKALPSVRETAGRLPRVVDRHVMPSTGNACLFVEEDWLLVAGPEPAFIDFLEGPVRNFLIGQSLVDAGKPWPWGERSHGKKGALEVYAEWFGTEDEAAIRRCLECLAREGLKGHWECPCGSGDRIRACHPERLRTLRDQVPPWAARMAANRLRFLDELDERQRALAKTRP